MSATLGFRELASRLLRRLNEMVQRGEVSERSLARLTGYSQPHVHNVLKGSRGINLAFADAALDRLGISFLALFAEAELGNSAGGERANAVPVPLMAGMLGAGRPFPRLGLRTPMIPFAAAIVEPLAGAVAVIIDESEDAMAPLIYPGDAVLLDRSPAVRRRPVFENVYAVCWKGRGYLGRCRVVGDWLYVATDKVEPNRAINQPLQIGRRNPLDIVRGRVVWVGHSLGGD